MEAVILARSIGICWQRGALPPGFRMTDSSSPSPAFWAGRRVLVTGHSGFKGAWACRWLLELGAEVWGASRTGGAPGGLFRRAGLAGHVTGLELELADGEAVAAAVGQARPEVVLHLGAQAIESVARRDPRATFETNVLGLANLLDAVRAAPETRAVTVVTTDRVYAPRPTEGVYREEDALGGQTPYGASKAAAELVVAAYRDLLGADGGARVATARTSNVIGGGDDARNRLVPDLLRGAIEGHRVRVGSPDARRCWQHVADPLRGYLRLAERLWERADTPGSFNFGPRPEDVRTVGWVAGRLAELWGPQLDWYAAAQTPACQADLFALNTTRARELLGWTTTMDVDAALRAVVAFARREAAGEDPGELVAEALPRSGGAAAQSTPSSAPNRGDPRPVGG